MNNKGKRTDDRPKDGFKQKYYLLIWDYKVAGASQLHICQYANTPKSLPLPLSLPQGSAKGEETIGRQDAEEDGHRLPEANRSRNRRSSQDNRGEQAELYTVRLAICDAISAKAV